MGLVIYCYTDLSAEMRARRAAPPGNTGRRNRRRQRKARRAPGRSILPSWAKPRARFPPHQEKAMASYAWQPVRQLYFPHSCFGHHQQHHLHHHAGGNQHGAELRRVWAAGGRFPPYLGPTGSSAQGGLAINCGGSRHDPTCRRSAYCPHRQSGERTPHRMCAHRGGSSSYYHRPPFIATPDRSGLSELGIGPVRPIL